MRLTTTSNFEDLKITDYLDIVMGVSFGYKPIPVIFDGKRSADFCQNQDIISKLKKVALYQLEYEANELGADSIIGIKIDIQKYQSDYIMLTASGTAVKTE